LCSKHCCLFWFFLDTLQISECITAEVGRQDNCALWQVRNLVHKLSTCHRGWSMIMTKKKPKNKKEQKNPTDLVMLILYQTNRIRAMSHLCCCQVWQWSELWLTSMSVKCNTSSKPSVALDIEKISYCWTIFCQISLSSFIFFPYPQIPSRLLFFLFSFSLCLVVWCGGCCCFIFFILILSRSIKW